MEIFIKILMIAFPAVLLISTIRYQAAVIKNLNRLNGIVCHHMRLLDILSMGTASPFIMAMYSRIRKNPNDEANPREMILEFLNGIAADVRQRIETCLKSEETSFEEKEKIRKVKAELDNIVNIVNTVDENSSMEYTMMMSQEVVSSLSKLHMVLEGLN